MKCGLIVVSLKNIKRMSGFFSIIYRSVTFGAQKNCITIKHGNYETISFSGNIDWF
jgi:hypothetical protein